MKIANRILAVAAALTVAAAGLIVAAEIALAGIGRGPWVLPYDDWYAGARDNRWESPGPRWLFTAVLAAGLAILVLQTLKGAPRSLPLAGGRSEAGVSRRSLERTLARTAGTVDGVSGARVDIDADRARVVVGTTRRTGDLRPRVEDAAGERLRALGLARTPTVVVDVNRRQGR